MAELYLGNTQVGGGGSGSADFSNYYTKTHIDASIGALDASVRTFAPVQYATLDEYDGYVDASTVDANKLYIITDVADTDDLAEFISVADLNTAVQEINSSLGYIANNLISAADSSIVYWKDRRIQEASTNINNNKNTAQNAINTAKNNAISDISTARENALIDINNAASAVANYVVMSESAYAQISTPDSSTIYFLT